MKLLQGIRVIDLSRYVAGPMAGALLADLGADVIRVEPPGGAEDRMPLPVGQSFPGGAGFIQTGRNKRGLGLDITTPSGRSVLDRLIATADILIVNLAPAALHALGLGDRQLRAAKLDLVILHLTAFGTEGPMADRVGFDAIAQMMSGLPFISGDPERPMKSAAAWVDMATGFLGAFAIMTALRQRDRTGQGSTVEVDLMRTALTVGNYFMIEQAFGRGDRVGTANRAPSGGPADLLKTTDGHVYLAVLGNAMFARFARLIGRTDLTGDARFASDALRADHGVLLSEIAAEWTSRRTTDAALAAFAAARLPAGPLLSFAAILADPVLSQTHLRWTKVAGLPHSVPYVRCPVSFVGADEEDWSGPPLPGAHTDALLAELGYATAEVDALRAARTI